MMIHKVNVYWKPFSRLGLFFIILIFSSSCSTKKNTWTNRNYHSVNAYFNGYFNARQQYNESIKRLEKGHIENYDKVLHIFRYGDAQQMGSLSGSMDMVYEKCSRVIRKHSMLIRGVEYNKRIPSTYLLIAKSHFFKQNQPLSVIALQHVVREYKTQEAFEAKVWIAKNHIFSKSFDQAGVTLKDVRKDIEDKLLNRKNRQLFYLVSADFQIRQGKFREAIPFIKDALKETKNKRERTRYTYILGQLYQEIGDFGNAQQTFEKVLKMSPTFELEFQARISMATAFDPATGSSQGVNAELNKMLNQKSNNNFKDRIFYAMAQLALREGNEPRAIELFKKSIEGSTTDRMQKGLSFLKLGELFFKKPLYLNSSQAYDSTVVYLPGNFENLVEIKARQQVLGELAKNMRIVEREDSLQRLAAMSPSEREIVVDRIISQYQEERRRQEQATANLGTSAYFTPQMRTEFAGETGWYFYNRNTMIAGTAEFKRRFGNRPLEDMWRIGNKQMIVGGAGITNEDPEQEVDIATIGFMDRTSLLQNIPLTPQKMEESNHKISQALFNKGMILVEKIEDKPNAIKAFERLVNQHPTSTNVLHAYYYLINSLEEAGQQSLAANYRNRLLVEHPNSDFARVLKDPNFRRTLVHQRDASEVLYEETYTAFIANNHQKVFENVMKSAELNLRPDLKAQYKYLKALTHGKQNQQELLKGDLTEIVQNHSGTIVHQPAQVLLASLGTPVVALDKPKPVTNPEGTGTETDGKKPAEEATEKINYLPSDDGLHFFVAIVDVTRIDVLKFTDHLKEFNHKNFRDRRLITTNVFFDENRQIVTVSSFDNKTRGMQYFRVVEGDPGLKAFSTDAFAMFIISVDNYGTFYQNKNVGQYLRFFKENF